MSKWPHIIKRGKKQNCFSEKLKWKAFRNGGAAQPVLDSRLLFAVFLGCILLVLFKQFPDVAVSHYSIRYIQPGYF